MTRAEAVSFASRMQNPSHPWLIQKLKLQKTSTIKPKRWKPRRQDNDTVQIDGITQTWGAFKRGFEEEIKNKARNNELIKFRQFKLNKGLKNEKLLNWNAKNGFESEDSENEQTNFDRFERQLYEQRR